jgi:hypothetical protein
VTATQTLVADVLDGLFGTWRADATLATYGDRLLISDGPPVIDRSAEIELWVGATGLESEETVVTGTQDWVTLGDAADDRDESMDVTNAIWVAAGSTDIKTARRLAITVFSAAAAAVRGSNLGINALDPTVQVVSWELHQGQFSSGVGAVLTFVVRATGQL